MLLAIFAFIAQFDTYSHHAYFDRAQFTYGYGTRGARTAHVTKGAAKAKAISVIKKHFKIVSSIPLLNKTQKTALTSFSYNVGYNAFKQSQLFKLVQQGDFCSARHEFPKWVYQSGRRLDGLVKRRSAEAELFSKGLKCNDINT